MSRLPAITDDDVLRIQRERHPLIETGAQAGNRNAVLEIIHLRAYEFAAEWAADADVLDVGCNTGYGTALLAASARTCVGVDVSARAIERAGERTKANLRFEVIDGRTLPFNDAAFDLVCSMQVIEHIASPVNYLAEIRRVMRTHGTAIFTTPNAALRLDPGQRPWNPFHVTEYRAEELASLLAEVFEEVQVMGMFARPDVAAVEYARVTDARRNSRSRVRRLARAILGPIVAQRMRDLMSQRSRRGPEPFGTADFWYEADRLDEALDLLAVCH